MHIQWHPVWDEVLQPAERLRYENLAATFEPTSILEIFPVRIHYKKNKGLVATVFIANNSSTPLNLTHITLTVQSDQPIAQQSFTLEQTVLPYHQLLWSFVFDPTSIYHLHKDLTKAHITVEL